jgi:hypothetical protein
MQVFLIYVISKTRLLQGCLASCDTAKAGCQFARPADTTAQTILAQYTGSRESIAVNEHASRQFVE